MHEYQISNHLPTSCCSRVSPNGRYEVGGIICCWPSCVQSKGERLEEILLARPTLMCGLGSLQTGQHTWRTGCFAEGMYKVITECIAPSK